MRDERPVDGSEVCNPEEVLQLSRELFYHRFPVEISAQSYHAGLTSPTGKFLGFAGRATLSRGLPYGDGLNLVFRIPKVLQPGLVTTHFDPNVDTGAAVTPRKGINYSLDQRFVLPLPPEDEALIVSWLALPWFGNYISSVAKRPLREILPDLRYLDGRYYCGIYYFELTSAGKYSISTDRVTEVMRNPGNRIDPGFVKASMKRYLEDYRSTRPDSV